MSGNDCIIITSNLTRDAELKYTPDGMALLKFSLPVEKRVKVGGEYKNETLWFGVTEFGKSAERHAEIIRKGSIVTVTGRLGMPRVAEDGRVYLDVSADRVEPVSNYGKKEAPQPAQDELPF